MRSPLRASPRAWALLALGCWLPPLAAAPTPQDPPSRQLLAEFASQARLAGTVGSVRGAEYVASVLRRAGWEVEIDSREVLLSLPRSLRLSIFADAQAREPLSERRERFDANAIPPGDVPAYSAWSASGVARGPVVDVGHGLRADFERLRAAGVELRGSIALARYGRCYRGIKVDLAAEYGCAGALLFNDPAEDGGARGATWPAGPWKPDTSAQRGSISPMGRAPGDPSTPGFASPPPGSEVERRSPQQLREDLPKIPCLPIGAREALALLDRLTVDGAATKGPGPVEVELDVDAPLELRAIHNVLGRWRGSGDDVVIAGNHRDAWVRGANDAGGGSVALMRAAQHLSERARGGWKPRHTIVLAFWDAEEFGLIGSTEWGEAHADWLRRHARLYLNADTAVSGTRFGASGTPGLVASLGRVLDRLEQPGGREGESVGAAWRAGFGERTPRFDLPGSGSDFAVFLHHLAVPVIDFGFGGNGGGQYHTEFDDFAFVERHLDPGFVGHELAGRFVAEWMAFAADDARGGFDDAEACRAMAEMVRAAGQEAKDGVAWLGSERAERLATALEARAARGEDSSVYAALLDERGLPGRAWYRNPLWAPGLETGYSAETLPGLRAAAATSPQALDAELDRLIERLGPASGREGR